MSDGSPSTTFAGSVKGGKDSSGFDKVSSKLIIGGVVLLIAPSAILVWVFWVFLFYYFRIKWWWPLITLGLLVVQEALFGFVQGSITGYVSYVTNGVFNEGGIGWFITHWWTFLFKGFAAGIVLGSIYATFTLWMSWIRRPKWQERTFRPGIFMQLRKKKTEKEIAADQNTPQTGITLGVCEDVRDERFAIAQRGEDYGKRVIIEDTESTGHALVTGGSGSGKALALDTPLPLWGGGYVTMGNVQKGDLLIGVHSEPVKVVTVSDVQHGHKCYRVTFNDGHHIIADAEHLWVVKENTRVTFDNVTTEQLYKRYHNNDSSHQLSYHVPRVAPLKNVNSNETVNSETEHGEFFVEKPERTITHITPTPSVPVKCVGVDSDDHIYLAGLGHIPTHNTTTMLMGMRDVIKNGRPLIVVDVKGGPDVPEQIYDWCRRYGRTFHHWTMVPSLEEYEGPADSPSYYDPLSRGDAARKKDLILAARSRWSEEHYKNIVGAYMQVAFDVQQLVPTTGRGGENEGVLRDATQLTNINELIVRANEGLRNGMITGDNAKRIKNAIGRVDAMQNIERNAVASMGSHLHTLLDSPAGRWLTKDANPDREERKDINLREISDTGGVVVFSLDSSNYEETANMLAGLIIQDIKTLSSELRHKPSPTPVHLYVDEFSAIDSTNIMGLLNKARDARIFTTIATQTLADLARNEPVFVKQVLGVINIFMVHRLNQEEEGLIFSGISGTVKKKVERVNIEQSTSKVKLNWGAAAGKGTATLDEVDGYVIEPGVFQNLKRGQCVYMANTPNRRVIDHVQIIREGNQPVPPEHHTPTHEDNNEEHYSNEWDSGEDWGSEDSFYGNTTKRKPTGNTYNHEDRHSEQWHAPQLGTQTVEDEWWDDTPTRSRSENNNRNNESEENLDLGDDYYLDRSGQLRLKKNKGTFNDYSHNTPQPQPSQQQTPPPSQKKPQRKKPQPRNTNTHPTQETKRKEYRTPTRNNMPSPQKNEQPPTKRKVRKVRKVNTSTANQHSTQQPTNANPKQPQQPHTPNSSALKKPKGLS